MQCNSTRFTNGCILKFLGFIKNYPACRPAACKKFKQSQLGPLIVKNDLDSIKGDQNLLNEKIFWKTVKLEL